MPARRHLPSSGARRLRAKGASASHAVARPNSARAEAGGFPPSLKLRWTAEALAEAGQPSGPARLKGSPSSRGQASGRPSDLAESCGPSGPPGRRRDRRERPTTRSRPACQASSLRYCRHRSSMQAIERILSEVDRAADEIVDLTADLVRIPTVNPPGEAYDACARFLGGYLERRAFGVEYIAAEGRVEHTTRHPRVNVIGSRRGGPGPVVHLNGHIDVVPAGDGWTVDPFGGLVRDGKIFGRGVCDMKAGIAAAVFAAEAIERAGVTLPGTVEISGTVDEESGGFAGVAHLAESGRIAKGRT